MDYSRKNINGTDPVDIKNLNDNFKYLFMKIFENIKQTPAITKMAPPTKEKNQLEIKDEINFPNGCFVQAFNDYIKIGCDDGSYITIENGCIKFYLGKTPSPDMPLQFAEPSYILKHDGIYNMKEKLILPQNGIDLNHATLYAKFY